MNKVLAVVAVASATIAMTACGGGSNAHPPPTPVKSTTSSTAVPSDPVVPKSIPNDPKVRKYVVLSECAPIAGGWRASGTVTNPGKSPVSYAVTVSFTTKGATVIGVSQTDLTVAPGKTTSWSVTKKLKAADSTRCVLRGVALA